MVEKPMAMNAAECVHMVQASQESGALLMVAHCFRFDREVRWLKQQSDSGRLGEIVRTKGYGIHANWGPGGWFAQQEFAGGGAVADMGIHAIDTTRFLLGDPRPVSVYAQVGAYYQMNGGNSVEDTGVALINWENGVVSYLEAGWWQPHTDGPQAATQLYGTLGFGELYPTRLKIPSLSNGRVEEVYAGFPHPRSPHCPQELYDTQMSYFINCLRSGTSPSPGGQEGWVNMQIVDAIYESARTGKVVVL